MTRLPERKVQMRLALMGSLLATTMHLTEAHANPTAYTAANTAANDAAAANIAANTAPKTTSETIMDLYKKSGIRVGGWINGGATFNPSHIDGFNGPVTFNDQANRFQLNQVNVFIERAVVAQGSKWDFGGRFDILFGTDAIFTQAYGVPAFDVNSGQPLERSTWDLDLCCASTRYYGLAIPQAYGEVYVPIGNGLNVKVGHFYTPIGYESVPAPNNFFYSHA
ncbi:MAG: porin, partial [Nitrosospira sp.]|nr:porin [Nitrosospira sp.]